jgi:putative polyhydroxyalkanoate system protein
MSVIRIVRKHNLDEAQIRAHLEELAAEFAEQIGIRYQWNGNQVDIERSGAHGFIRMMPGELELELKLGMLLRPMKGKIEQVINDYLDKHLA